MVKITKTQGWADGTHIDAHEGWNNGSRNRDLLESDCFAKCYICEDKPKDVKNLTVDHIISKDNDPRLEYVWENLLLACAYCNHEVKGSKYNGIINPCETDPEEKINFEMSYDRRNVVISTDSFDKAVLETKQLLDEVYSNRMLTRKLTAELNTFDKYIPNAISGDDWAIEYIQEAVSRCSIFAAFKRKIVRDDPQLSRTLTETSQT
ncbi:MAG: HNH endonuclease [Oscillospiraceae bacterium]|nr:HNH endonuclease [Oscillospiraceae bacterium]